MTHHKAVVPYKRHEAHTLTPFAKLDRELEELFKLPLPYAGMAQVPDIDMKETDKEILLSVHLPGVDKKDIKLDLKEDYIAISCEHSENNERKGKNGYYHKESSYGRMYRSILLPAAVKTGESKAAYKNGVLRITLRKQPHAYSHHVTVS